MNIAKQTNDDRTHTFSPGHLGELEDERYLITTFAAEYPALHSALPHRHVRAQLLYAINGVMTVSTGVGAWVVPPQQAVWIPAGTEHDVYYPSRTSMRSLYVHPTAAGGLPDECCVVSVPPLLRELIIKAASVLSAELPNGKNLRLLQMILDELRELKPAPLHLPLPRDPRLRLVTDALFAEPADERSLDAWGESAGASARTLARLFVKETGLTFGRWRQQVRLLSAISLLAAGEPITTIAYELGYRSPSAFVAMFRRSLGVSPGRYLRSESHVKEG